MPILFRIYGYRYMYEENIMEMCQSCQINMIICYIQGVYDYAD